ncbi:hypothetical protein EJ05DRAFT_80119 [Pseudovirgaria hyperparasitica]|uniref:Cyclin C-terminal domain-containing protein n=1 Tax=Pseudovirgaria hyperparasitica TaxID=470096 RepID=A0A6A6W023_9PEZI|nr:uncharacterized protein EJ05DRAFT_80119 [Pseudovirgaria hyperparasitica]KAF2755855.1 hypothetical protein EJ05DRAFT_80119 [Pseudovirgaria hyperparasitica]
MHLNEDAKYRTSTQFRYWNFTPDSLASLRRNTNRAAVERVKAAFDRRRKARIAADKAQNGGEVTVVSELQTKEVECLTLEEEQKLLGYYCAQCLKMGKDNFKYPANVYYMKRFYLFNSPMTYHPKDILKTALFVATKTENHHQDLDKYCGQIGGKKPTLRDDVLAPEFILTQALRFTFEVRHPFRAVLPGHSQSAVQLQQALLSLPQTSGGPEIIHEVHQMEKRITEAHSIASDRYLKNAALLTDAYFLYTPSQIWLAAHLLADEPLTLFYLDTKFTVAPGSNSSAPLKTRVISTIRSCATMISNGDTPSQPTLEERAELTRVDKKLYQCRNPDKIDLIGLNKAQKRDATMDGKLEEGLAKKRKIEREKQEKEADDFWGPPLPNTGAPG